MNGGPSTGSGHTAIGRTGLGATGWGAAALPLLVQDRPHRKTVGPAQAVRGQRASFPTLTALTASSAGRQVMTVTRIAFSILIFICSTGFAVRAQSAREKTLSLEEVNSIIRQLVSEEGTEQRHALNMLTLFATEADQMIEVIPKQLEDQSPEKRIEALQALDKFSRKALAAVPALLEIVDGEDRELRWASVQLLEPIVILGIQSGPGVFAALYEREQHEVREAAEILLKTLHMARYRTIVDALSFLRESDHPIKTALAKALKAYDDFFSESWDTLRECAGFIG